MRRVGYYAVTIGTVEQEQFPYNDYSTLAGEGEMIETLKAMHKIKENVSADIITSKICVDKVVDES